MPRKNKARVVTEYVTLNGSRQAIKIYYETRRNCRASIVRDGMNIRIPAALNQQEQTKRIESLKQWGLKKLAQRPVYHNGHYFNHSSLKVGNKDYRLCIDSENRKTGISWVEGNDLIVKLPGHAGEADRQEICRKLVRRAIAHDHLPYIRQKVEMLNSRHFQEDVRQVRLRYNHSNWGSCSSNGNITISTRVLLASEDVIDYVCIHELAHLREPNHSHRFWRLVYQAMPNFREKERWLKRNGHQCYF